MTFSEKYAQPVFACFVLRSPFNQSTQMVHKKKLSFAVTVLVVISVAQFAMAQSGTRSYPQTSRPQTTRPQSSGTQTTQGSESRAEAPFDDRFWGYLQQAQYRNWASLPGVPAAGYPGNSPHGERVKLYVNRTAAVESAGFQSGSILIKENYDATGEHLMALTVMYRSEGFAPNSGDWYWVKYEPSGQVSTMNNMRISGRVGMCIDCHRSAGGDDFVFANDR